MDCVYVVRENTGNFGGDEVHYERQSIKGITTDFFPGNVAFIEFRVRPMDNGYYCDYEISTLAGEMLALNRWPSRHENENLAKAATLEKAVAKVGQFKSYVNCKVANQDAVALIKKFTSLGEAERSAQHDAIPENVEESGA
jgi:tagatose-1,6-bisphosphate aldolase non-catalytic subunit AgaZ/GatZ